MQGDHDLVTRRIGIGPGLDQTHPRHGREMRGPAPGGLPVAVVGIGQRRGDNDDLLTMHPHSIATLPATTIGL